MRSNWDGAGVDSVLLLAISWEGCTMIGRSWTMNAGWARASIVSTAGDMAIVSATGGDSRPGVLIEESVWHIFQGVFRLHVGRLGLERDIGGSDASDRLIVAGQD